MNRNFGIHKYFNNVPTATPEANDKPQGYSELDSLRNELDYLKGKNNDTTGLVTPEQKEHNLKRIAEIEARIKEIETPATAVLAKTVVDNKPQHGTAAPGEVLNAVKVQQVHTTEVVSATAATAAQTVPVLPTDDPKTVAAKTQFNADANTAGQRLDQHNADKAEVRAETAYSVKINLQDSRRSDIAFEGKEEKSRLSVNSLIDLIVDLDEDRKIEVENGGWFSRTFKNMPQKHPVGEAQLKTLLAGKSYEELQAIYSRITGGKDGNNINITRNDYSLKDNGFSIERDGELDYKKERAIREFRQNIIDRAVLVAGLTGVVLNDPDQRAGLASVINGTEEQYLRFLQAPENRDKIKEFLARPEMQQARKENSSLWQNIVRIFANVGISLFGLGYETSTLEATNSSLNLMSKSGNSAESKEVGDQVERTSTNLSAKGQLGENASIEGSFDIVAVRGQINWNDPQSTLNSLMKTYAAASDKKTAIENIIKALEEKSVKGVMASTKRENQMQSDVIADSLRKTHADALVVYSNIYNKDPQSPRLAQIEGVLKDEIMRAIVQMMQLRSSNSIMPDGLVGMYGIGGVRAGLAWKNISTGATFDGVKSGAAHLEAQANKNAISEAQLQAELSAMGISLQNGKYIDKAGNVYASAPTEGERTVWNITKVVGPKDIEYIASAKNVAKNSPETSHKYEISVRNEAEQNAFINENSQRIADYLLNLRGSPKTATTVMQQYITKGDYVNAEKEFLRTFKGLSDVVTAYNALPAGSKERNNFLNQILAKTSGGQFSRSIADDFNRLGIENVDATKYNEIVKTLYTYYEGGMIGKNRVNGVANVFAKSYGLEKPQVMSIMRSIVETQSEPKTYLLGEVAPKGFVGMVAYNQRNGLVALDSITNSDARVFGEPQLVTNEKMANDMRAKLKTKIPEAMVADVRDQLAKAHPEKQYTDEEIKNFIVAGPVKSYLSYEHDAECFNLGFFVEPGAIEWKRPGITNTEASMIGVGSVVGKANVNADNITLAVGVDLKKGWSEPEQNKTETTPGHNKANVASDPIGTTTTQWNVAGTVANDAFNPIIPQSVSSVERLGDARF